MNDDTAYPARLHAAFGADRDTSPAAWTWVDLTDRLVRQSVRIRKGRADDSSQPQPSSIGVELKNKDGYLTPTNPLSQWYPNVRRGTPIRYQIAAGPTHLTMPGTDGNYASVPDNLFLDVTTGLFVAFDVVLGTGRKPPSPIVLGAKWVTSGNQRTWLVYINTDGTIRLRWSNNGTAELDQGNLIPFPIDLNGRLVVGLHLTENNGAGGHVVTWYTAPSLTGTWTTHEARTFSGTTSVFVSTAPIEIGTFNNGTPSGSFDPFVGTVNAFQLRQNGPTGTIAANPDFTIQTSGARSFQDSVGWTWSLTGTSSIDNWQTRFTGEIVDIAPKWPANGAPGTQRVNVVGSGLLRRLTQGAKPLSSALFRRITAPIGAVETVWAYWPGEDGRDSQQAYSPLAGVDPGTIDMTYAADDTLAASKALPQSSQTFGFSFPVPPTVSTTQWEVTFFVRMPTAEVSPTATPILRVDATGTVARWDISINDTDVRVQAADTNGTSLLNTTFASDARFFDTWMIVTLSIDQDGADVDWDLDLIPIPLGSIFGSSGTITTDTCGRPTRIHSGADAPPDGITFGHWIVTTGAVTGWLAPADTAYVSEPASQRIRRLCEEEGIPVTVDGPFGSDWSTVVAAGVQAMGPQRPATLADLLIECAEVDLGVLSEMRTIPGIAYRTHTTLYNQTAGIALDPFSKALVNPFEPAFDDQRIRNDITASRPDGSSSRVTNDESIAAEGVFDENVTVNVSTDSQLGDQASWRVEQGSVTDMRYPRIAANVKTPAVIADWLTLRLGDLVQVTDLPDGHPLSTISQVVEGYDESLGSFKWLAEMTCSPANHLTVGVLDADRQDTAGSELAVAVDSDDTTWSVATTEGPLWTTDNAEDGFDVTIGGEEVTVTDIATIPVTFGAAGTAAHANNANVTPGTPASIAAGNLLLIFTAIRNSGAGIPNTPTGYIRLPAFPADANAQLFAKIATSGSETAPTISFTGGVANADTSAQMIRLGGSYYDVANLLVAATPILNGSNQDIPYPPLYVPEDNCIVLFCGWKQDDWTSVATIGGATEIGEPDTTTGDDQGIVWDYVIQTTKANIAAGSFVVTGGVAAISRAAVVALRCDIQTFTVVRSANDVVKSHAVGSDIRLANPLVLAL